MKQLVVLTLAVCFLSCDEQDSPTGIFPLQPDVIIPLKLGNQWTLRITEIDSQYRIVATTYDTSFIVRDTTIGTEKWFFDNHGSLLLNRADGLWRMVLGVPSLFLKYPAAVGQVYTIRTSTTDLLADIGSTDFTVIVPAGIADCYLYRFRNASDSTLVRVDYFEVNKGLIKSNLFARTSAGIFFERYQCELLSRTLN